MKDHHEHCDEGRNRQAAEDDEKPTEEFPKEQLSSWQSIGQGQPERALRHLFGNAVVGQEDDHQAQHDTNHKSEIY